MEVFKNYVEFMFKDLPQEERVNQAKYELLLLYQDRIHLVKKPLMKKILIQIEISKEPLL